MDDHGSDRRGIAGATIPTAQAYIADVTPAQQRTKGMALIGAAFGLGFTLGPLVGAAAVWMDWTAGPHGMSPMPGYVASLLSATALTVALFKLPESCNLSITPSQRKRFDLISLRQSLSTPSIALLLTTSFLAVFALAGFEVTISLTINDKLAEATAASPQPLIQTANASPAPLPEQGRSTEADERILLARICLIFAYIGLLLSFIQGVVVRRLSTRISEGPLALVGLGLSIAGFLLLGIAVVARGLGLVPLMLATAVEVAGIAMATPAVQSLVSRRSAPTAQGGILGAGESISSLARMTGMAFGFGLYYTQIAGLPYWSSAGVMALALALIAIAIPQGQDWVEKTETAGVSSIAALD